MGGPPRGNGAPDGIWRASWGPPSPAPSAAERTAGPTTSTAPTIRPPGVRRRRGPRAASWRAVEGRRGAPGDEPAGAPTPAVDGAAEEAARTLREARAPREVRAAAAATPAAGEA